MDNMNKVGATCQFKIDGIDLEKKSIPVILSDETEVVRYSWDSGKYFLTLKHGKDNVDLTRKDILSLFVNHNTYELPIGKFENVRVEDKKLKANAVFDPDDEESMKIFNKLAKGFLQSFSVGITINKKVLSKEEDGIEYYDVTDWSIDEASVVGIPAIPTAKVGLNLGVNPAKVEASAQIKNSEQGDNIMDEAQLKALADSHAEALNTAGASATQNERARVSAILALSGDESVKLKAITDGSSVGDTAIALNAAMATSMSSQKTDFEQAAAELQGMKQAEGNVEELTDEAKKEKEALSALDQHFGKDK